MRAHNDFLRLLTRDVACLRLLKEGVHLDMEIRAVLDLERLTSTVVLDKVKSLGTKITNFVGNVLDHPDVPPLSDLQTSLQRSLQGIHDRVSEEQEQKHNTSTPHAAIKRKIMHHLSS